MSRLHLTWGKQIRPLMALRLDVTHSEYFFRIPSTNDYHFYFLKILNCSPYFLSYKGNIWYIYVHTKSAAFIIGIKLQLYIVCSTQDYKYSAALLNNLEHVTLVATKQSTIWIYYKFNYSWISKLVPIIQSYRD